MAGAPLAVEPGRAFLAADAPAWLPAEIAGGDAALARPARRAERDVHLPVPDLLIAHQVFLI